MNVTTVGIDLAKNVFSVHGVDIHGKVVIRKTVSLGKLLECFANLPPAIILTNETRTQAHFIKARAMPTNRPYVEPQSYTEPTSTTVGGVHVVEVTGLRGFSRRSGDCRVAPSLPHH